MWESARDLCYSLRPLPQLGFTAASPGLRFALRLITVLPPRRPGVQAC